jgi:hypothetical protein
MSPRPAHASTSDIETRRRQLTEQIATLGPILPGSLVTRTSRCGNRGCRCHTDPDQLHGPYLTWTRSVGGKTVTRVLTPEQAERAREWFDKRPPPYATPSTSSNSSASNTP